MSRANRQTTSRLSPPFFAVGAGFGPRIRRRLVCPYMSTDTPSLPVGDLGTSLVGC
jgi:hypothetical protein